MLKLNVCRGSERCRSRLNKAPHGAGYPRPQGRQAHRVADLLSRPYRARCSTSIATVMLVGDSLGMVMHGLESTMPVTLEMMILQGQAVMRGSSRALVVVDMPFGSYEASQEQAFLSARRG